MNRSIFLLFILSAIISCKKQDTINTSYYRQCHNSQNADSSQIATKIIGSWKWKEEKCGDGAIFRRADKDVTITFSSLRTFTVRENSTLITQGTWDLKIYELNSWGLNLTERSEYLYGLILLCGNEVVFNHQYLDGCDHLFVRSN